MPYLHGIRVLENPTSMPTPAVNEAGVPVIFGTAPVNTVADPAGAVNKLFLCNDFAEAQAAVGYSDDFESYTLCQAMYAFFNLFAVGPVVLCNVLDPDRHRTSYSETLTVIDDQAKSAETGVLLDGLAVGGYTLDEDYTAEFDDDGYLVLTFITTVTGDVEVSGYKLDASQVTASDVIGSYDTDTGKETGIQLVRQVYPAFGVAPSLLLAPGFSQIPEVGLALASKCENISGMFRCECVVDIDTEQAPKYTDVEAVKAESAYSNSHMIVVWPKVKCAGKEMFFSAVYAAMTCDMDVNNDSVPNLYPSNRSIKASAAVLEGGEEVLLDISQANELNAIGVVTALNLNGFKAWGNNTSAYPDTTDPKDRWIGCRRFFSWWGNNFVINYLSKVDDLANYRLIESIVDSENVRGNALVSQGRCAGIKVVYNPEDNPIANVLDGKLVFRTYLAPYTPAEDICDILEYDTDMLEAALGGE